MTQHRQNIVSVADTPYYHCIVTPRASVRSIRMPCLVNYAYSSARFIACAICFGNDFVIAPLY